MMEEEKPWDHRRGRGRKREGGEKKKEEAKHSMEEEGERLYYWVQFRRIDL